MLYLLLRALWRFVVFLIGIVCAWAIYKLYPYAHDIFPFYIVAFIIYCVAAYFIIPALTRLLHVVIKPDHIPLYATTRDGIPSDPVNLAIIARDKRALQSAMRRAGWYQAEANTLKNSFREALSIMFDLPYPHAPVSTLYLFNRPHDIAFQIPTGKNQSARARHHVRFWRLREPAPKQNDHDHFAYWAEQLRRFLNPVHRSIWIGAAIEDSHPVGIRRRGTLTHRINTDADAERDLVIESLKSAELVKKISTTKRGEKTKFRGQQFRNSFIVDGSLKVIEIK
ncbi:MAG TPA: LssY C-terminal domain-containing protein [Candidatus Saccharimonadaceae bacterium]|nr:LssY C-terminal domain-containing protein [Candidatus Saccharimonadaceae bacterium]